MQSSHMHHRPAQNFRAALRMRRFVVASVLCLAATATTAGNPPELAAEQLAIDRTSNTGVGDGINQEFAQVFQVYDTGKITHVMLPLNCLGSPTPVVRVTLQKVNAGMPSGRVLASQDVPGYALDTYPAPTGELGLRMVQFDHPARVRPGTYAFTVSGTGGICVIWYGPPGNVYTGGNAYLSTQPGRQPGVPGAWNIPMSRDLTFQVFQEP